MRLRGCILAEIAMGVGLLTGSAGGVYYGGQAVWEATEQTRAFAASVQEAPRSTTVVESANRADAQPDLGLLDRPDVKDVRDERPAFGLFRGVRDDYLIEPLRNKAIKRVRFNRGGSSLSLRIDFVGGARAAYKPDQINLQTIPRREVAAFRINRLLGLDGVPPAIARSFPLKVLVSQLIPGEKALAPRLLAETKRTKRGMVAGELSWWIPKIVNAKIGDYEIDSRDGIVVWKRYLQAGAEMPAKQEQLLAQISSMVAFDFLINNTDRWSGANCKGSPDGRYLYYMDNTLAFGFEPDGHPKVQNYLSRVQKFSATMVRALKRLHEDDLREIATKDRGPYRAILTEKEIVSTMARRDHLVSYIEGLIAEHGEAAVLVFP